MSQLPQRLGVLNGWGRTAPTAARVQRPRCAAQVAQALAAGDARGVIARGLAPVPRAWRLPLEKRLPIMIIFC